MTGRRGSRPSGRWQGPRAAAHDILRALESGRGHSNLLLAGLPEHMPDRDRRLATELVYGVLRRRSELDRWIARVSSRPIADLDADVLIALRVALHQVLHLERVPRSAAVDQAVRIVRARGGRPAAAFANAVLRQIGRLLDAPSPATAPEGGAEPPAERLAARHSFPPVLVERWLARLGLAECDALLLAMNRPAPVVLRPTRLSGGAAALAARLAREDVRTIPSPLLPEALRVVDGVPQRTGAFHDGWLYIQDEASQIVTLLLEPLAADGTLLDACAAPGGKFLGARDRTGPAGGVWLAADRSPDRLRLLRDNARRLLQETPRVLCMDAERPALRTTFDRVLVDAPCSGTGIIRRHPEIRWRRSPDAIAAFASRQQAILLAAAALTAPRGRIVYAVCSLEPEEGPERIGALLSERDDLRLVDVRGVLPDALSGLGDTDGTLRLLPHRHDTDGFFAAVLEKQD